MRTRMRDKGQKQGKKRGKLVTMPKNASVTKQATKETGAAAATGKAAPGIEGSQNKAEETAAYKGAKKALRNALKAKVKAESAQIAETLVQHTLKGDLRGAEMVLSLIVKKKEEKDGKKKKKRSGPSWAELLSSEPDLDECMEDGGKKLTLVSSQ